MPHYVIDRFEGPAWAVLEDEEGKTFLVPRRWLPTNAGEGDIVVETSQPPDNDTVSLNLQLDPAAREERLARLKAQRDQLPKGPKGDVKL
jgi:hypothetical protein